MKYIVRMIVVLGFFLILGCGDGSSDKSSGSSQDFTNIKILDVANKDMVKVTRNNASDLMEDSQLYLPDFDSLPFDELLSQKYSESDNCPQGGRLHIVSNPLTKTVSVNYQDCKIETIKITGKLYFNFEAYDGNKIIGTFTIVNLNIEGKVQGIQFNGQGIFHHDNFENGFNKYYIEAKNLTSGEVFKSNYYIDTKEGKSNIKGVFLRPDGQYYTMQSKHVDFRSIPIIGGELKYKDTLMFSDSDIGKIVLKGDKSELTYQKVNDNDIYRIRENLDEIKPMYSSDARQWKRDITEFVPNDQVAQLYLSADEEAHRRSFFYSPYQNSPYQNNNENIEIPEWEKVGISSKGIYIHVADEDSYGEYIAEIELLEKPNQSILKIGERSSYLLDNTYAYAGEFQRESDWALTQYVNFDVNGLYKFKVVLHDGSDKVERIFIAEYYKNGLTENEHIVNYSDVKRRAYIASSEETLVLTPTKLFKVNKDGSESNINLNSALDMAFFGDSIVYVLDGEEALKINLDTMSIEKRFSAKEEYRHALKSITVSGEDIYIGDKIRIFTLDRNSESLISIGRVGWPNSKMFVNEELNHLYYAACYNNSYDGLISLQLPGSLNDGDTLQFKKNLDDEIVFWRNVWQFDNTHFLTSRAELVRMSSSDLTDLTSDGYLDKLGISHTSDNLIRFAKNKNSGNYLFVTKSELPIDISLEEDEYSVNTLRIYSSNMELKFETMLRNQYIDSNGKKYKIFLTDALFVGDTKVSVLYSAKEIVANEYNLEFVSDDISFYLEDTKTIE